MDKTNEFRLFEIKNRIKQAIQGNIMYALSKDGFFDMAALHGDKARRLQYDLEGFSGHLEFSLFKSDPDFCVESILPVIERGLADKGLGLNIEIIDKPFDFKKSVVLKGNTREVFTNLFLRDELPASISDSDTVNVRFELNYDPPRFAGYETKTCRYPSLYKIAMYDKSSLFADCCYWLFTISGNGVSTGSGGNSGSNNSGNNGGNNGGNNSGNNGGNNNNNSGNNGGYAVTKQCEDMTKSGQYTGNINDPFGGVALYANNDAVSYTQYFGSNTHDFVLRACSNGSNMARVDLVIDNQTKGTFYYGDQYPAEYTIKNVYTGTGNHTVKLVVTADDGTWDAYLDYLKIS